jgi:ribosomal protein S12 methylthiotransferase accessory factor YcaO
VQVTIRSLPNQNRLMLPRALAERLHAALDEALAQGRGASDASAA